MVGMAGQGKTSDRTSSAGQLCDGRAIMKRWCVPSHGAVPWRYHGPDDGARRGKVMAKSDDTIINRMNANGNFLWGELNSVG